MTDEQREAAMISARYYMPYLSANDLLAVFRRYNRIIREVAKKTGSLLVEHENEIPGDPMHFNDTVHFKDAGSRVQADRIVSALLGSAEFQRIAATKKNRQ